MGNFFVFRFALTLMQPEHRAIVTAKYESKILNLLRKSDRAFDVDEEHTECPYGAHRFPASLLACPLCKIRVPFCVLTVKRIGSTKCLLNFPAVLWPYSFIFSLLINLIDWFAVIDCLICTDWLIDLHRLIRSDWLLDWLIYIDWLIDLHRLIDWFASIDWLIDLHLWCSFSSRVCTWLKMIYPYVRDAQCPPFSPRWSPASLAAFKLAQCARHPGVRTTSVRARNQKRKRFFNEPIFPWIIHKVPPVHNSLKNQIDTRIRYG